MPDLTEMINPQALKAARKRQGMSQQELANAIRAIAKGCTKDTVSRWERGKTSKIRPYLREALCSVLRVDWKELTKPTAEAKDFLDELTAKVSIGKKTRASLQIVSERYGIRPRAILELAPLLFLIVAEKSMLEREQRLREIRAILQEAEKKLLKNSAHLGGIITARSSSADDQLHEECESLAKRDVLGRTIKYEYWEEGHEGPFVQFVRGLTEDLPKDAVTSIESFNGEMIEGYQIADDTLRERTGISENEEQGRKLLGYIRDGMIDFTQCLRIRRDGDETKYRDWLSHELAQAEEASRRLLEELFGDIESSPIAVGESNAPEKTSDR